MINNIKQISNLRREDESKQSVIMDTSYISRAVSDVPPSHHNWQLCQDSRLWWEKDRQDYYLYVAEITIREIKAGTIPQQVKKRLNLLIGVELLPTNAAVNRFAKALVDEDVIGKDSFNDALHIATGCVYKAHILLTTNMKDMANEKSIQGLNKVAAKHGITPVRILTPRQMLYNKRAVD